MQIRDRIRKMGEGERNRGSQDGNQGKKRRGGRDSNQNSFTKGQKCGSLHVKGGNDWEKGKFMRRVDRARCAPGKHFGGGRLSGEEDIGYL